MLTLFLLGTFSALLSLFITYPVIWLVRFFRFGQAIREEGPASHQAKSGTPTMAGLGFVATIIALSLIFVNFELDWRYLALIALTALFALIGLADDLLKVTRHKNLGLTFRQKILLQTLAAALFSLAMVKLGHAQSVGAILGRYWFAHPTVYFLLSTFIVVGSANAANLTDGLNGLLAGTGGTALLFFAWLARRVGAVDAASFAVICGGAVLVFLCYNFPKARAFMGDVGSLAVGAALGGLAIVLHQELRLAVIGGVLVIEALSVILQVSWFKLFKRKIFRMSPLHHHFELLGIPETKVVVGFWVVGLLLGFAGILL